MVPLLQGAGGIDRRVRGCDDLMLRIGRSEVRVAANVVIGQHIVPKRMAVLYAEPVTPVVSVSAVLRRTTLRIDRASVRSNAKVATADLVFLSGQM